MVRDAQPRPIAPKRFHEPNAARSTPLIQAHVCSKHTYVIEVQPWPDEATHQITVHTKKKWKETVGIPVPNRNPPPRPTNVRPTSVHVDLYKEGGGLTRGHGLQ